MGAVPSSLTDTSSRNPFDAFRRQQQAESKRHRTLEQIVTFATVFDPRAHAPTSIVIPDSVTSTVGLPALTQDVYLKMMTSSFTAADRYIPDATNVVIHGNIVNLNSTDTLYDPLKSFQDATGTVYSVGPRLGAGSYGVVHALTSHTDRVVKVIIGDDPAEDGNLLLEMFIQLIVSRELRDLRARIGDAKFTGHYADASGVHGLCAFRDNGHRYVLLVMDKAAIPFDKYLQKSGMNALQRTTTNAHVTYQLCKTLKYLIEKLGFNHRDMKCDNLMVTPTQIRNSNGVVLVQASLIDFGMSRLVFNGRLFSSNWRQFMHALKDDTHPHPDHDMIFFLLSMIWEDGCGLEVDSWHSCGSMVLPEFYRDLVQLLCQADPEIAKKYRGGSYSGVTDTGDPKWWEFYTDAFNVIRNVTVHGSRSGLTRFTLSFAYIDNILKHMKYQLRQIAHDPSTAQEPLFFGRRRRRWSNKYKKSIDCNNPKGFSQKQYCTYGRKK
jgi:serine/threonine protein kinase